MDANIPAGKGAGAPADELASPAVAKPVAKKRLSLALQGGGTHGAFTWGAMERLLEDERIDFDGFSGTSAGAINGAMACKLKVCRKGAAFKWTRRPCPQAGEVMRCGAPLINRACSACPRRERNWCGQHRPTRGARWCRQSQAIPTSRRGTCRQKRNGP